MGADKNDNVHLIWPQKAQFITVTKHKCKAADHFKNG